MTLNLSLKKLALQLQLNNCSLANQANKGRICDKQVRPFYIT